MCVQLNATAAEVEAFRNAHLSLIATSWTLEILYVVIGAHKLAAASTLHPVLTPAIRTSWILLRHYDVALHLVFVEPLALERAFAKPKCPCEHIVATLLYSSYAEMPALIAAHRRNNQAFVFWMFHRY